MSRVCEAKATPRENAQTCISSLEEFGLEEIGALSIRVRAMAERFAQFLSL